MKLRERAKHLIDRIKDLFYEWDYETVEDGFRKKVYRTWSGKPVGYVKEREIIDRGAIEIAADVKCNFMGGGFYADSLEKGIPMLEKFVRENLTWEERILGRPYKAFPEKFYRWEEVKSDDGKVTVLLKTYRGVLLGEIVPTDHFINKYEVLYYRCIWPYVSCRTVEEGKRFLICMVHVDRGWGSHIWGSAYGIKWKGKAE